MVPGLFDAGSEGPGAGVAETSEGDAECWDMVAGVFWTGSGLSWAVAGMGWICGVGSDGSCCCNGGWVGIEALVICGGGGGGPGWSGGCVTGGKAE